MYKKQEHWLIILAFFVAFVIGLSILGRIFSG